MAAGALQSITFTATVAVDPLAQSVATVTGGSVLFTYITGSNPTPVTLGPATVNSSGVATLVYSQGLPLNASGYTITAHYPGNPPNFAASSTDMSIGQQVWKATTTNLSPAPTNPAPYGGPVNLTVNGREA